MKYVKSHYNVQCYYHTEVWCSNYKTYKECVKFLQSLEKEEIPDKVIIKEVVSEVYIK